jgi:hypothetical protein
MKNRIEELKKQCYVSVIDRDGDNEYDMDKFAALIIQEVIAALYDEIQYATSEVIPWETREAIYKRLGVE